MSKALSILLVEDDQVEVMKFKKTISTLSLKYRIKEAKNGEEAIDYLNGSNERPDIILLDLNMPKINGLEFLKIIKSNDDFKYIPTVILTTSSNITDKIACYQLGVSGYMVKPLKFADYVSKITKTLMYWEESEFVPN